MVKIVDASYNPSSMYEQIKLWTTNWATPHIPRQYLGTGGSHTSRIAAGLECSIVFHLYFNCMSQYVHIALLVHVCILA